jgi:hypothetical protein
MITIVLVDSDAKQLLSIPLSSDTVTHQIWEIAEDLNEELAEK